MALRELAQPSAYPVSLALAKSWVRETTTDNDAVLDFLRKSAVDRVERFTHLALVYRPVLETLDYFTPLITLSEAPLLGVNSVKYLDVGTGTLTTLATSKYRVDNQNYPARITPEYSQYWPPTRPVMNSVLINYDVGYLLPVTALASNTLTVPGHRYADGDVVQLSNDGDSASALTGITLGQIYYALNTNITAGTLQLSATSGGGAVAISSLAGTVFCGTLENDLLLAMQLMIGSWFENRESFGPVQQYEMPAHGAAEALMWPFKVAMV